MFSSIRNLWLIIWVNSILAIICNWAGYWFDLYQQWWWFDRATHALTLSMATFWLGYFVELGPAFGPAHLGKWRAFLLLVLAGIGIGAIWELAEWSFDHLSSGNIIKGKYDTMFDLVVDMMGSAAAAAIVALYFETAERRIVPAHN